MSVTIKNGAMIALAAGGILALAATAEFGLTALAVGASMSLVSGALAVKGDDVKVNAKNIPTSTDKRKEHNNATCVG